MRFDRRHLMTAMPGLVFSVPLAFAEGGDKGMQSMIKAFDELPLRPPNRSNAKIHDVVNGTIATGEALEVHETTLPVGGAPHAPHKHLHSELFLVRQGEVEVTIEGKSRKIGAGGAAFIASNEMHGISNAGRTPATYFVVSVGQGADQPH